MYSIRGIINMNIWNELNKYEKRRIVAGVIVAFIVCAGIVQVLQLIAKMGGF